MSYSKTANIVCAVYRDVIEVNNFRFIWEDEDVYLSETVCGYCPDNKDWLGDAANYEQFVGVVRGYLADLTQALNKELALAQLNY